MRSTHLIRRFIGSLSRRPPSATDQLWVESILLPPEMALWNRFTVADQRHSIEVARRFVHLRPDANRAEMAASLLHDIGKLDTDLGTLARVVATVVGPRTDRLRRYHDHERIGGTMLRGAGSDPVTVDLVAGRSNDRDVLDALRRADDL